MSYEEFDVLNQIDIKIGVIEHVGSCLLTLGPGNDQLPSRGSHTEFGEAVELETIRDWILGIQLTWNLGQVADEICGASEILSFVLKIIDFKDWDIQIFQTI